MYHSNTNTNTRTQVHARQITVVSACPLETSVLRIEMALVWVHSKDEIKSMISTVMRMTCRTTIVRSMLYVVVRANITRSTHVTRMQVPFVDRDTSSHALLLQSKSLPQERTSDGKPVPKGWRLQRKKK